MTTHCAKFIDQTGARREISGTPAEIQAIQEKFVVLDSTCQRQALGKGIRPIEGTLAFLKRNGIDLEPQEDRQKRATRPLHVGQCRETGFSTGFTCFVARGAFGRWLHMESTFPARELNPIEVEKVLERIHG